MTTNAASNGNNGAAVISNTAGNDLIIAAAKDAVRNIADQIAAAEDAAQGGYETVAAIVMNLAEREVMLSRFVKDKQVTADFSRAILAEMDAGATERAKAANTILTNMFMPLFEERYQSIKDYIGFAARLAYMDYKMTDFTGEITSDNGVTVKRNGVWLIKPRHIARTNTDSCFPPPVPVWGAEFRDTLNNAKITKEPFPKEDAVALLNNRLHVFYIGEPDANNARKMISVAKVGRQTFMTTTSALIKAATTAADEAKRKADEAAKAKADAEKPSPKDEQAKKIDEAVKANPDAGKGSPEDEASRKQGDEKPAPVAPTGKKQDQTGGKGEVAKGKTYADYMADVRMIFSAGRIKDAGPDGVKMALSAAEHVIASLVAMGKGADLQAMLTRYLDSTAKRQEAMRTASKAKPTAAAVAKKTGK